MSDGHAHLLNCWWANIDWEVRGCCFDVGWVQWSWSIQEFFEVFYSSVLLLFNVSDYLALLFTGRSGLRRFPESFFVMSYSCLMFPSLAAFSAVDVKSSTYLRLSVLMLLFTCLFTSVYSACDLAFSALVRMVLIAAFLFLLS
ncbi:unnamed protein product [Schistosoma margrebowiei]|uniref:Uncharacterized protein n=1 Tax=Schistosoma margrebowiei TaxID=48269 RepID=A0A3P8AT36_9TREM|nr:unnamed protein product [Schistosoma margrebowiei]